jgi:hypothetical protein
LILSYRRKWEGGSLKHSEEKDSSLNSLLIIATLNCPEYSGDKPNSWRLAFIDAVSKQLPGSF